ncbi:Proteasome subunit beta type-5-like protein [Leptotrombidium deliense]|uniref:Proteasome subunit beta n=1 Tax=Leptotrombidium deliense TaxID=299467 RepID=A0A443SNQ6_9ACAR|nr:Proteasome subunit beta type-5-like protein [Leptotrombidium deliense]
MALQSLLNLPANPKFGSEDKNENDIVEEWKRFSKTMLPLGPRNLNPGEPMYYDANTGKGIKINYAKGTTTLAFKFQGGVLVATDSRATGGEYIASQEVKKVIEINNYLLGTMAGGAADCVYWERVLSERCRIYELRNREPISVAAASKLLSNILYNYKGMGLSLGVMISGWDKKGPGLYYVDNDGNRFPGNLFSVGSGSTYAYGVLDTGYDYNMSDADAIELGRRSILAAAHRDIASGGKVRIYHVTKGGWKFISLEDASDLWYKYQDEKMV